MIGYKGFNEDLTCRNFQYEIGGVYETKEPIKLCGNGFHFCLNLFECFDYYPPKGNNRFALVEIIGDVIVSKDKCCTNKIKVIRELTEKEIKELSNKGEGNYGIGNNGDYNKGFKNSGGHNKGDYNTGSFNIGNKNEGYENCGHVNKGRRNYGYQNCGDDNKGTWNEGQNNCGTANEGNFNRGDNNIGNYNVGSFNIGDGNVGFFNIGNGINGIFNKPAEINYKELMDNIAFKFLMEHTSVKDRHMSNSFVLQYKTESFIEEFKEGLKKIPNFNSEILSEILEVEPTLFE